MSPSLCFNLSSLLLHNKVKIVSLIFVVLFFLLRRIIVTRGQRKDLSRHREPRCTLPSCEPRSCRSPHRELCFECVVSRTVSYRALGELRRCYSVTKWSRRARGRISRCAKPVRSPKALSCRTAPLDR